jgi:hypothetical protein
VRDGREFGRSLKTIEGVARFCDLPFRKFEVAMRPGGCNERRAIAFHHYGFEQRVNFTLDKCPPEPPFGNGCPVWVRIVDEFGNGVAGASLTDESGAKGPSTTDEFGRVQWSLRKGQKHTFTVSAFGFRSEARTYTCGNDIIRDEIHSPDPVPMATNSVGHRSDELGARI